MARLEAQEAIQRFRDNENRLDRFINGSETTEYNTSDGRAIPSLAKVLKDFSTTLNTAGVGWLAQAVQVAEDVSEMKDTVEQVYQNTVAFNTSLTASIAQVNQAKADAQAWATSSEVLPGGFRSAKWYAENLSGGTVSSFNNRIGVVEPLLGDYSAELIQFNENNTVGDMLRDFGSNITSINELVQDFYNQLFSFNNTGAVPIDESVTLEKLAPEVFSLVNGRVSHLTSGTPLPTEDIGPLYHADYNSILVWEEFTANGADYSGYACPDVGMWKYDNLPVARKGHLKLNGSNPLKVSYAALWNWALHNGLVVDIGSWVAGIFAFADNGDGTFKLPDVRGEFRRAWDDGRGVDVGRLLGSYQADDNKSHTHTGSTNSAGSHSHGAASSGGSSGSTTVPATLSSRNSIAYNIPTNSAGAHSHTVTINADGGSEARPRNVASLAIIKF